MNPNNTSNYLYIILLSLILIVIGAPGCNTIEAGTAAGKPGSSNPLATETQVVNKAETGAETTPMPDNLTYVNNVYGFAFEYPGTWTLSEENHGVLLLKGRNRLGIRQRWVDEEISPNRTGIPAGELVYGDKIRFMGKVIPAEFLQFECKNKIVFYGGTGDIEIDDLMFSITLEDRETYDYREIDLSEEVLDEAKAIVESFRRIDRSEVSTQAPIALETGLSAHIEIPEILPVGENVNLKFVLKNSSDTPLYVLTWYTPLEGIGGKIFRVNHEGRGIPYEGILAYRRFPIPEDYVYLKPGGSVSAVVDLAKSFDFSETGEYTIKFLSPQISYIARTEDDMAKTMEELGPVNIPSNEVSVELVGSPLGEGLPRLRTPEEAQEMIEAYLRDQNLEMGVEPILPVEELHIVELWDSLGAQVFRMSGGKFVKESFLIRGAEVIQLGAALGGQGVTSLALADLDQDDQSEMYFAYSSSAENPHSRIGMYIQAYDEKGIIESGISYLGHLRVYKIDGFSIGVQVVEGDPDTKTLKFSPSIGFLALNWENGEMKLIIHLEPGFVDENLQKIITDPTG